MTGIDITPDFAWLAIAAGPEPYFLLLAALVVDALVGLAWRARGRAFDRLAAQMLREPIRRLGRAERSAATHLIRGLVLALAALAVAGVAGAALGVAAAALPFGWALGLAVLLLVVDQRAIFATLGAALRAPPAADDAALRQALESATLRYAEGVVALAFWYGLLGVAGLVMYRVVLVLALLFDRPGADDAGLGFVPLRLHEAAAWIPLRLAGLLVAFAALFTPGASFLGALAAMVGHSPGRRLRSAAWPVAAAAGALGIALAGPRHLDGPERGVSPWITPENARRQVTSSDARRCFYLLVVACVLAALVVLLVAMIELAERALV
jgi:adenosylcobinamide-phosphate synthase